MIPQTTRGLFGLVTACALAFAAGCSGGSPATPDLTPPGPPKCSAICNPTPSLWGYWEIRINPASGDIEILPLRGCEYTVDVVTFLQPPSGNPANLGIQITDASEWMTQGLLTVDVRLTHPFPGLDQYTGHDVKGVFIAPGNLVAKSDPSIVYTDGIDQPILLNADGYTRWMNPVEFPDDGTILTYTPGKLGTPGDFNATINAYKYFADNLEPDDDPGVFFTEADNVSNRGQFSAGSSLHRTYELKFPLLGGNPYLVFQYAVIAHWVEPDDLDPYDLPGSFPPEANAYEPVHLGITDNSTLYYTGTASGGDLVLDLEIYAWPTSAGESLLERITRITVESQNALIPGNVAQFDAAYVASNGLPGSADNSSVVPIEVTGCQPDGPAGQEVLIILETDGDYSNDGAGTIYPDASLSAYFRHDAHVGTEPMLVTVTSIDPDEADQHDFVDDAIITGTNFVNVTSVRLEQDTEIIESADYTVDSSTQITADFDLAGYPHGLYDVVVEVSGSLTGTLEDGFEILIQCGTAPPELDGVYTLGTYIQPTMFATVLTDGPYAGMTCTHNNTATPMDGRMYVLDHTTQADNTPATSWFYQQGGWGLECGMSNGLMIALGAISATNLRVYNQTSGSLIQTVPSGHLFAICGDLDGNDDFWCIVNERPTANPNWYGYYLQHYAYSGGTYTFAEEWDVTDLFADEISSTYRWEVFGDLVILPDASVCFVLTGTQGTPDGHKVDKVDLTGASPAIIATHVFTESLDGDGQIDIAQSRAVKMDIDFSDEDYTHCRLIVAGSSPAPRHLHIYRFDTDLNLLGHSDTPFNIHGGHMWYGMTLDMEHDCIALIEDIPWYLTETYYGYCSLPSDW